jgi:hypothetical protein
MRTVPTPRLRRIGAREAEQLLTGGPTAPDRRALARLLSAAAAPARPAELAGEEAVRAAFVRAYNEPASAGSRSPRGSLLARAALAKVLAGTAVLLVGGTALAAGTGHLPAAVQRHAHDLFAPSGGPAPSRSPGIGGRHPGAAPYPGGGSATPTPAGPAPSAALPGLCRAYVAGRKDPSKALQAPAFQGLAAAAGGADNIPEFCAGILADTQQPGGKPSPGPAKTPPGHGGGPPSRAPHGKPTATP